MTDVPLIAISSPKVGAGKTTLAFNLIAALLRDGYRVGVYSQSAEDFLQKRSALIQNNPTMKMPENITKENLLAQNYGDVTAVVADIQTEQNKDFIPVFSRAHTLITIVQNSDDILWQPSDSYLNLVWNVKKHQAAAGIKYLNWVVVENKVVSEDDELSNQLVLQSRRFGFRPAPALEQRKAYTHIAEGYGAADLIGAKTINMSMADVYARRELLVLADFVWQQK